MSEKTKSLDYFLFLLKSVKKMGNGSYMALCPGHNDREQSLSVKEADGKILVKCFDSAILLVEHEFITLPKVGDYLL